MSDAITVGAPGRRTIPLSEETVVAGAAVLAAVAGPLVLGAGGKPFATILAAVIFVAVVIRPQFGAYLFLVASPLIAGVARGDAVPILRPNEALFMLILAAFATRTCGAMIAGSAHRLTVNCVDTTLILMVVTASILPILLRAGRGLSLTKDDVLYSIVLVKYFILYLVFRGSVSTPAQVAACLWLSLASASVVAVVAVLQVSNLFGTPEFLFAYYDQPFEGHAAPVTERGTSTLASSFSVADVMAMNLVIAIAWLRGRRRARGLLIAAVLLFISGCVVAGAFSGFIGLAVAVLAVGFAIGRLHRVLALAVPATAVAAAVFWPVIAQRLAGFERPSGLPRSWEGRWDNLQRFFFPDLFSGFNWLVGVRPAPRLPASEAWRDWVYIESGYVWLLWIGGVPLLAAFACFAWISLRELWRIAHERNDAVEVAAAASFAYLVTIVVLMLFDPHLTVRGSADLFFPLLALSLVRGRGTDSGVCRSGAQAPTATRAPPRVRRGRFDVGSLPAHSWGSHPTTGPGAHPEMARGHNRGGAPSTAQRAGLQLAPGDPRVAIGRIVTDPPSLNRRAVEITGVSPMHRDAVPEGQELPEEVRLGAAERRHVRTGRVATQQRVQRDHQYFQLVPLRVACALGRKVLQNGGNLFHGSDPSPIRGYPIKFSRPKPANSFLTCNCPAHCGLRARLRIREIYYLLRSCPTNRKVLRRVGVVKRALTHCTI